MEEKVSKNIDDKINKNNVFGRIHIYRKAYLQMGDTYYFYINLKYLPKLTMLYTKLHSLKIKNK